MSSTPRTRRFRTVCFLTANPSLSDRGPAAFPKRAAALALAAAFAAVLLATILPTAGCAPQEKEILVDPELPLAEPYDGGTWEKWTIFAAGMDVFDVAARSEDEVLVATGNGSILHLTGGEIETWMLPAATEVIALATGPGELVFALDGGGQCYRRDGAGWRLDWPYGAGQWAQDLWCDEEGTVYACGRIGLAYEEAEGRWTSVEVAVGTTLRSVWGRSARDVWAVGGWGRVLRRIDDEWKLSTPFGTELDFQTVTGDEEGRVALFAADGSTRLWDGHFWQTIPPDRLLKGVFLLEGRLHGYTEDALLVWNGRSWDPLGDFQEREQCRGASVSGRTAFLAGPHGWVVALSGGKTEIVSSDPGVLRSLLTDEEGVLALTDNGWLLRREDADWRVEALLRGWIQGGDDALARDDRGRLVALVDRRITMQDEDGTWSLPPGAPNSSCNRLCALTDGTLCFALGGEIWTLKGGLFSRLGEIPADWFDLRECGGIAGSSVDDLWLLTDRTLMRHDGVAFVPVLLLEEHYWDLAYDEREGALIYRGASLIAVDASGRTRELTPQYRDEEDRVIHACFDKLCVTASGDWLGLDRYGWLLRRVGERWEAIRIPDIEEWYGNWYGVPFAIEAGSAARALLLDHYHVWRFEDPAVARTAWGPGDE